VSWESDELFNTARRAEENGDLLAAHRTLSKALQLAADEFAVWIWYAQVCRQLEQFAEAIDAFEHAIQLQPTMAGGYSGLGTVLAETGRFEEAERALSRSMQLRPSAPRFVLLADVQVQLGKITEAEESLRAALQLEPDNEEALFNLAMSIAKRDPVAARPLLAHALEADPRYAAAHRELAWIHLQLKDHDPALAAIDTALALDPDDARAHIYRGHVLITLGRELEAQSEFESAHRVSPMWSLPLLLKGRLLEDHGDLTKAESAFRMAAEIDPTNPDALTELARYLVARNQPAEAEQLLNLALEHQPEHGVARKLQQQLLRRE